MDLDFSQCILPPYKHQERGIRQLVQNKRFALWWEMRLGKTKSVIDTASFLFQVNQVQVVVIACPAQVKDVWGHKEIGEIKKHCFVPYKVWEFNSITSDYLGMLVQAVKTELVFITVSHEFLRQEDAHGDFTRVNQLLGVLDNLNWWLVIDEAAGFGNYKSMQTKAMLKLRNGQRTA